MDPQRAQETPFLVVFLSVPELAVQPWAGHISDLDLGVLITKTKAGFPEYWSMEEYWGSCIRISCRAFHFLKKILFTWLFLERGEGREKGRETSISCLSFTLWELNLQSFALPHNAEPHWSGLGSLLNLHIPGVRKDSGFRRCAQVLMQWKNRPQCIGRTGVVLAGGLCYTGGRGEVS